MKRAIALALAGFATSSMPAIAAVIWEPTTGSCHNLDHHRSYAFDSPINLPVDPATHVDILWQRGAHTSLLVSNVRVFGTAKDTGGMRLEVSRIEAQKLRLVMSAATLLARPSECQTSGPLE